MIGQIQFTVRISGFSPQRHKGLQENFAREVSLSSILLRDLCVFVVNHLVTLRVRPTGPVMRVSPPMPGMHPHDKKAQLLARQVDNCTILIPSSFR
jgi:hypothetical protein